MSTLGWLLAAVIWIPTLYIVLVIEVWPKVKRKLIERRMEARLKQDGRAYQDVQAVRPRPMDLTEPLGRKRLGMPTKEEE